MPKEPHGEKTKDIYVGTINLPQLVYARLPPSLLQLPPSLQQLPPSLLLLAPSLPQLRLSLPLSPSLPGPLLLPSLLFPFHLELHRHLRIGTKKICGCLFKKKYPTEIIIIYTEGS
jgi:hypothetical protein